MGGIAGKVLVIILLSSPVDFPDESVKESMLVLDCTVDEVKECRDGK